MTDKNENEKLIAELDQAQELLMRTVPAMLFNYYQKLQDEGFTKNEAFVLTTNYHDLLWK